MKKWTLDELESLEDKILELYQNTDLSTSTLTDCMGKIDTERYELNKASDVGVLIENEPYNHDNSQLLDFCEWYKTTSFNCEGNPSEECVVEYLTSKAL